MSVPERLPSVARWVPVEHHRFTGHGSPTFTNVQLATLVLVITAHLSAGVFVLSRTWIVSFSTPKLALIAIPLAQSSLVTLAVMGRWAKPHVRFALAIVVTVWCWFVVMQMMGWSFRGPGAASMALSLMVQSLVILTAHQVTRGRSFGRVRFGISAMLGWLSVAAFGLALWRRGPSSWGWSTDAVSWGFFFLMPIICIGTGLVAVVVDVSLSMARPIWQRVLVFALGMAGLALGVPMLVAMVWSADTLRITTFGSVAVFVSMLLYISLFPLRYVLANHKFWQRTRNETS